MNEQKILEQSVQFVKLAVASGLVDRAKITSVFQKYQAETRNGRLVTFQQWLLEKRVVTQQQLREIAQKAMTNADTQDIDDTPTQDYYGTTEDDPPYRPQASVPQSIGRYLLQKELGQGGMGKVYEAIDTSLERRVALKVMIAGDQSSQTRIQRFIREAKAVARLQHPNIVTIYEIDRYQHMHYFAMDLVDGPPLNRYLRENKVSTRETIELLGKICAAIHYAHGEGIIHRDLKPGNIILDGKKEPKIVDFGLAKVDDGEKLSQTGVAIGTPHYMAPEQVAGEHHLVDARTDVYALGVILYEMLTGQVPFSAKGYQVYHQIISEEPVPPRERNGKIPTGLSEICLKAMAKERDQRYPTAMELAEQLQKFALSPARVKRNRRATERMGRRKEKAKDSSNKKSIASKPILAMLAVATAVVLAIGAFFLLPSASTNADPTIFYREAQLAKKELVLSPQEKITIQAPANRYLYVLKRITGSNPHEKIVVPVKEYFSPPQNPGKNIAIALDRIATNTEWFVVSWVDELSSQQISSLCLRLSSARRGTNVAQFRSKKRRQTTNRWQIYHLDFAQVPKDELAMIPKKELAQIDISDPVDVQILVRRKEGGEFYPLADEAIHAGDKLQLKLDIRKKIHLAIFLKDSRGKVEQLYPLDGEQYISATESGLQSIPRPNDGFEFDDSQGSEWICYFFDSAPLDSERLKHWLGQTQLSLDSTGEELAIPMRLRDILHK